MQPNHIKLVQQSIGKTYSELSFEARHSISNQLKLLLSQRKLPPQGWTDLMIQNLLHQLAILDSNNYRHKIGVGEREGRTISSLVARRHYYLSHGIGRSGQIAAVQPKAAGSSLLADLTNSLVKHAFELAGISKHHCIVVPVATGMALTICLLSLKQQKPNGKYVIWPRIDQKTCFKCIFTAGLQPVIVEPRLEGYAVVTGDFEGVIRSVPFEQIVCVLSTTSCFAPRAPDNIQEISAVCKELGIPHIVNNAYGLQCKSICGKINYCSNTGRIDYIVQSTDKNFLVPVGGAVIASIKKQAIRNVSSLYPGRASVSASLDLFITLLSLGQRGFISLLSSRQSILTFFKQQLEKFASQHNQDFIEIPGNTISFIISLKNFQHPTQLGSHLFKRRVFGTRAINPAISKQINSFHFDSYGASYSNYPFSYLTAACALGITQAQISHFISKLNTLFNSQQKMNPYTYFDPNFIPGAVPPQYLQQNSQNSSQYQQNFENYMQNGYQYGNPFMMMPQETSFNQQICPYYLQGGCRYGAKCWYFHPTEGGSTVPNDVECSICLQQVKANKNQFGLLLGCSHIFCLPCIRKWRGQLNVPKEVSRSCPICRTLSHYVLPSDEPVTDYQNKIQMQESYKQHLSSTPCREFNFGEGECPFGSSCFYQHKLRDGTDWVPKKPEFACDESGVWTVYKKPKLSDFLNI